MTAQVALLRAVNVAGHNKVGMADLRRLLADLGLGSPRSYIQSGNLLFEDERTPEELERLLERESAARLGLDTAYFIRTADEWSAMIAANPFPGQAKGDPGRLAAMPLKAAPSAVAVAALQAGITGNEMVQAVGRTLYAVYPDGFGRSRLTTKAIESALDTRCTGRNWKTVLKLGAMLRA